MPYPGKVLTDGEEVVAALHPHASTVFWPVVRLLLVVGSASFGMAMIPAGSNQGVYRLVILGLAVLLVLMTVARPLMPWRTRYCVINTHRLLHRVPGSERVQTLLNHMIEEDADRRAQGSARHPTGGWGSGAWGNDGHPAEVRGYVTEWGTAERRTACFSTRPVS